MTEVVGHFLVFTISAIGFLLAPLLIGKLVRPRLPTPEKDAAYECGEPTIGSSYIQFDLRFYVVALLFIIFDVEVVFFFPWATVFGNAMQLADTALSAAARQHLSEQLLALPTGSLANQPQIDAAAALTLGWTTFVDVLVFFGVLLVGFAYVWKRGDLDWVRSTAEQRLRLGVSTTYPLSQSAVRKPDSLTAS
ncbi:NADH-quinone oxidoreductase subunit A [Schlesneria paludicola]|uniref:NADH-quinone oxidoreductase subunit A n=1 Tax=Schlesneria paludicola TaxID=360056 RepID=UPI00029AFE56|nr:NADH-quinone oxidoreductase subunit A [Schlesneria paludicola]